MITITKQFPNTEKIQLLLVMTLLFFITGV